jgi:hypothetical protein
LAPVTVTVTDPGVARASARPRLCSLTLHLLGLAGGEIVEGRCRIEWTWPLTTLAVPWPAGAEAAGG